MLMSERPDPTENGLEKKRSFTYSLLALELMA